MLDEVRRGSGEAWSQLVDRYQGRLLAYSRRRVPRGTDAEDLVQDTFLQFLRGINNFRQEASLETFLFVILRRRLAEVHRGRKISACDLAEQDSLAGPDPTASRYARRGEQRQAAREALSDALASLVNRMHKKLDFRDLQIVELLFYAQRSNQQIAHQLNADPAHVALLKHRWIKELRDHVAHRARKIPWDDPAALDCLMTQTWEEQRPSCPKRSTIGGFLLGTLDDGWQHYVDFHINALGCSFCRASLDDLRMQTQHGSDSLRRKIMQSTVGFFH